MTLGRAGIQRDQHQVMLYAEAGHVCMRADHRADVTFILKAGVGMPSA